MPLSPLISYHVATSSLASLSDTLRQLKEKFETKQVIRLTIFYQFSTLIHHQELFRQLHQEVALLWGEHPPLLNLIAQTPLDSELALELQIIDAQESCEIVFENTGLGRSITCISPEATLFFLGELQIPFQGYTLEHQAEIIFHYIQQIFDKKGYSYNSITRQWNYIEHITALEGQNQHYQLLNNARSRFYQQTSWPCGYPAATGIGTQGGGLLIDLDAYIPHAEKAIKIIPIDNRLQVAAHAYSQDVLIDANQHKTTPKFERAKAIQLPHNSKLTYISGTAAIRGEESLTGVDARTQTLQTIENIDQLIHSRNDLKMIRVYIKDAQDFEQINHTIKEILPDTPAIYVLADVCREELLVEIEGIAYSNRLDTENPTN